LAGKFFAPGFFWAGKFQRFNFFKAKSFRAQIFWGGQIFAFIFF